MFIITCDILQIGSDVADNRPHMVKFTFNTAENMVNVIYNSEHRDELDFPFTALGSRFNTLFEGQIYIGGHPDFYSLPWNIYSRSGFVGCVSVFQVSICRVINQVKIACCEV